MNYPLRQLALTVAILLRSTHLHAQQPDAAALQAAAQPAIDVSFNQYGLNSKALVEKIGKPMPTDGKWSISGNAPACPQTTAPCVRVIYRTLDSTVTCEWTVLLNSNGKDGKVLEQNDDATKYLIRKLSEEEAKRIRLFWKNPIYPDEAKRQHLAGEVRIAMLYSETGALSSYQLISGLPLLRDAALEGVSKSTSKPLMVGTRAIPYQTTVVIHFNFNLGH